MMLGEAITFENGMLFLAGALSLTFFSLRWVRRNQRRVAASAEHSRDELRTLREQAALPSTMSELMVQLEEFSRRINAQLDTKFARLETVVRDADDRIAKLKQLLTQLGEAPPQAVRKAPPAARAPRSEVRPATDNDAPPKRPAPPAAAPPAKPSADPVAVNPDLLPRHETAQRVYALADRGATPIQIAEETDLPLGEVELLLNLRQM
ncbi:MAG: hypothetical protein PVJ57_06375 [Phycisphaerae bacterium]|jgi:hypothetical protein